MVALVSVDQDSMWQCGFWLSGASVSFGAVKARLYDAPGATKVTVAEEGRGTLAPSQWKLLQKAPSLICSSQTKPNKSGAEEEKATLTLQCQQKAVPIEAKGQLKTLTDMYKVS